MAGKSMNVLRAALIVIVLQVYTTAGMAWPNDNRLLFGADGVDQQNHESLTALDEAWSSFKSIYKRGYSSSVEEEKRKAIFSENLKIIDKHNFLESVGLRTFKLGVNQFADLELKEFKSLMNGYRRSNKTIKQGSTYLSPNVPFTLPDSVDWRDKGYVTPVKDQGKCGSCWSFSTTGSLEGQTFKKGGQLVSLSEQNLVDCSSDYGNQGCDGGLMDNAFKYIKDNGGIDTEDAYPYEGQVGDCRYDEESSGATVSGFVDVESDESKLQEAVANIGPISAAIDAGHNSFQLYKSGVYNEPQCTQELDHAILVVGYGRDGDSGADYWLVKNSWSTKWGENGYIRMARNKDNQCGIANQASYPLV